MVRHNFPFTLIHPADQGGCGYYRIIWPATELLKRHMMNALVTDKLFDKNTIGVPKPEIALVQRQYYDHQIEVLREYQKAGVKVIYELDDDIMHVPAWSIHYKQIPADITDRLKRVFKYVDKITVTTEVLANELRRITNKPIHLVANYLPPIYRTAETYKHDGAYRIGWAGALAHKNDLALLEPIMKHFGKRVEWVFMGLLPENIPSDCIVHEVPGASVGDYPLMLKNLNIDVGLIPLEDNKLNRSKSGIKVMEMGIGGCAIIAQDMEPYKGFTNISRASKTEDWIDQIEDLVQNRDKAWAQGEALRNEILANHMLDNNLDKFMVAWEQTEHQRLPAKTSEKVSIIVPCQKDGEATEKCFESLVATLPQNETKTEIIVVDDMASADVKQVIRKYKDHFAHIVTHNSIKGFSGSVNDGIILAQGDVVLLNSDTEVYTDWVDRLHETSRLAPNIASVTPFCDDDSYLGVKAEKPVVELDDIAATYYRRIPVEIGTPVGFCMYIKHEALEDCGTFDNIGYPRAYGEENDWGCIARLFGWKHYLAPSVVIKHLGGRSTGDQSNALRTRGLQRVLSRYHFYQNIMQSAENPGVRSFKSNLELRAAGSGKPAILMVSHNQGGGLETYVKRMSKFIQDAGWDVYIARPHQGNIILENPQKKFNHMFPASTMDMQGAMAFSDTLKLLNVKLMHVQTLTEYPLWISNYLQRVTELANIPYDVTIHEAFFWCPQLYMTQQNVPENLMNRYCDSKDIQTCQNCTHNGSMFGFVDIEDWRAKNYKFLAKARHIYTTSDTYRDFVLRYVPEGEYQEQNRLNLYDKIKIRPHAEEPVTFKPAEGNAVAIIAHNLLPLKGLDIIKKLIKAMPMTRFVFFGNPPQVPMESNVKLTGPYKDQQELDFRVKFFGCSVSLQLSLWPEVWMYSLTDSLRSGLHPVVFDIGLQGKRLKEMPGVGAMLPVEWMYGDHTDDIAGAIQALLQQGDKQTKEIPGISYANIVKDYYELQP